MSNDHGGKETKSCVCRICLDSKCGDMILLDDQNGWFTLYEYCFGFALTMQDEPRLLCKMCAANVTSYSKFKKQCEKSDRLWRSVIPDVKLNTDKINIIFEADLQTTEQNFKLNGNESQNNNEPYEVTFDNDSSFSNVDFIPTEIKVEIGYNSQSNHLEELPNEEDSKTLTKSQNSETKEAHFLQNCSENLDNAKKFYTCKACEKKYTKKKWYLTHLQVCKTTKKKISRSGPELKIDNDRNLYIKNVNIDNQDVKSEFQDEIPNITQNQDCLFCGLCKFTSTNTNNLCKHLDEHWTNNDLACQLCEYVGEDLAATAAHRYSHYPLKRRSRYLCHICQKLKFSLLSLQFHYRMVHLKKPGGFCMRCNKQFKRLKSWKIHDKTHNAPGYICDICGKRFVYKYLIRNHVMDHTNPAKHICDKCGKVFRRTRYLKLHIKTVHSISGPLECTHCSRMFKSEHTLNLHQKTVARSKPYRCEICFKAYHAPTFLKSHMVMHSDERPHCCDVCGSRYKAKSQLKVHMRNHTGYMPFKCVICSKEFATSNQLKVHSSVHTGVRAVSCVHCPRTFHTKKLLAAHCALRHKNENCE